MALSTEQKTQIIKEYRQSSTDTGSVEVQVALLSADIELLTEHFKKNKHDHHSRRGLMKKVNQRRTLLKYLQNKDIERYRALIKRLELRG